MAMNVKFLKGVKASLPTSRDGNTLYFVTDEGALYLGATLIGADFTSAIEAANAAIKVINDHGYVNSTEVGTAIGTALESYYTKSQIDSKIGTLKIGDTNYDSVVDYVVAKTTGIATDAVVAEKVDKVIPTRVGLVPTLAQDGNLAASNYTIDDLIQTANSQVVNAIGALNAEKSSAEVEAGKGIQVTVKEVSGKLTAVSVSGNYDNKYDALGAANSALEAAKEHVDEAIDNLIKTYLDGETDEVINTLEEVAAWINNDTAGVTKIIEDVATNAANIKTINESAVMTSGITSAKVGEYDTVKSTVDTNKSTWDSVTNKLDASTYNTFVGSTYATLDAAVAAANAHADAKDTDIAKGVEAHGWGDHASAGYAKSADLGDLAGKDETDLNLKALAHKDTVVLTDLDSTIAEEIHMVQGMGSMWNTAYQTIYNKESSWDTGAQLAGTAVQPEAISDMLTKTEAASTYQLAGNYEVAGAAAAVQGSTNATVADVVNAVNALNAGQMEATNGINAISTSVADIIDMLTWGEFPEVKSN